MGADDERSLNASVGLGVRGAVFKHHLVLERGTSPATGLAATSQQPASHGR